MKLLRLDESGIRVARYLTQLPARKLLAKKLHEAIQLAREQLAPSPAGGAADRQLQNVDRLPVLNLWASPCGPDSRTCEVLGWRVHGCEGYATCLR